MKEYMYDTENRVALAHLAWQEALAQHIAKLVNVIIMTVVFAYTWLTYYHQANYFEFWEQGSVVVILLYALTYFAYGHMYDAFRLKLVRMFESGDCNKLCVNDKS